MATSKQYLEYITEQLSKAGEISHRAMMGEYLIYYREKVIGGLYDNRFLVKNTKSASALLPGAPREIPYEGATKSMICVADVEDTEFIHSLLEALYAELDFPKKKSKRG